MKMLLAQNHFYLKPFYSNYHELKIYLFPLFFQECFIFTGNYYLTTMLNVKSAFFIYKPHSSKLLIFEFIIILIKYIIIELNTMNLFTSPYFYIYQKPSLIPNPYFSALAPSQEQNYKKYIKLLESQNILLREKIENFEQKLRSYEHMPDPQIASEAKVKKIKKEVQTLVCPYVNCIRQYKSNLSLNLHIKIKHNGGSVRQREAYAKLIIECESSNKPKPQIKINFPPNFIENYRKRLDQGLLESNQALE